MVGLKAFSNINDSMIPCKHTHHEPALCRDWGHLSHDIPTGDPKSIVEGGSMSGGEACVALCPSSTRPSRNFPQPLYEQPAQPSPSQLGARA